MSVPSRRKKILKCFVFTMFVVGVSYLYFDGNDEVKTVEQRLDDMLSLGYIAELEDVRRHLLQTNATPQMTPRNLTVLDANEDRRLTFFQTLRDRSVNVNVIWLTESERTLTQSMVANYYKPVMNQCSVYRRENPAHTMTCFTRPEDVEEPIPFSEVMKSDLISSRYSVKPIEKSTSELRYNLTYMLIVAGAVVTSDGEVIKDEWKIIPMRCRRRIERYYQFRPTSDYERHHEVFVVSQLRGTTFFHFLIENLTRIAPYLSFLMRHPHIKILVQSETGFTPIFLAALGIEPSRLVSGNIRADIVYMPAGSPCGHATILSAQMLSSRFRAALPDPAPPRDTIILMKRSKKRWFNYHDDILAMLRRHADAAGLKTVVYGDDPVPGVDDTLRLFSRAYLVVAPHGAGESNLIFSQPGTILIEGLCYDSREKLNWCYKNMVALLGHRYCGLLFEKQCMNITAADVEPFVKYYVDKLTR